MKILFLSNRTLYPCTVITWHSREYIYMRHSGEGSKTQLEFVSQTTPLVLVWIIKHL
jgi:hypothetical protein